MITRRRTCAALLGGLAALSLSATPASASERVAAESLVEAGYTAKITERGVTVSAVATVTVATLACADGPAGVVTSVGVVEVPYRFAGGRVYASCVDGSPAYEARLEASTGGSQPVDGAVAAGDRIMIIATWDGSVARPEVDVVMRNRDQGWRATAHFSFLADGFNGAVFRQSPMWVDGSALPLAIFDGAGVRNAAVGGDDLAGQTLTRSVLVDAAGDWLVVPSRIRAGDRFTFSRR